MSKYHSKKITVDDIVFDSKREARRYKELLLLEKAGEISGLERQVKYVLIPAQYSQGTEVYKSGKNKGKLKPGKLLERECAYYADFRYEENGRIIVEDVKSKITRQESTYKIKKKLMLYIHGIQLREML